MNHAARRADRSRTSISIFDVDRTLTRRPTYSAFLIYAAWRTRRHRLLLLPAMLLLMLAYKAGAMSRRRLKERMQDLMLGARVHREQIEPAAEDFARGLLKRGLFASAAAQLKQDRAEGRLIFLASAANDFYIAPLAALIGADHLIATRSIWEDDHLLARIEGENCYGPAKLQSVQRALDDLGHSRLETQVRFYSDHISDRPTFEWADEVVVINPARPLAKLARSRGWAVKLWR